MYMKKLDELLASNAKLAELLGRKEEPKKKCNAAVCVLAVIGAIAAVALIAYAVYRYLTPDYLDDDFDDWEDYEEFEDDEDVIHFDSEGVKTEVKTEAPAETTEA